VDEAIQVLLSFFHITAGRRALQSLKLLQELGLGYLRLGQPINTLSGGESQRLKLASHMAEFVRDQESANQRTLFLFDEPTTGLHFEDIRILLKAFQRLVDEGHSLLVIEHNLDLIRAADWIIDLGPEGGAEGGKIVVEGTPEQVTRSEASHTGRALREHLELTKGSKQSPDQILVMPKESPVFPSAGAISIQGAREHNLKNLSLDIPRNRFVVVTGVSGSGKSTLAFDLLFAEGQRRFLDSMNTYARQFVEQLARPDVDLITGIPPTVSIEQRTTRGGGKSTVATVTEIYHFLRLLFRAARHAILPGLRTPGAITNAGSGWSPIKSGVKAERRPSAPRACC
jgi:excinuclease ABC subunit A